MKDQIFNVLNCTFSGFVCNNTTVSDSFCLLFFGGRGAQTILARSARVFFFSCEINLFFSPLKSVRTSITSKIWCSRGFHCIFFFLLSYCFLVVGEKTNVITKCLRQTSARKFWFSASTLLTIEQMLIITL